MARSLISKQLAESLAISTSTCYRHRESFVHTFTVGLYIAHRVLVLDYSSPVGSAYDRVIVMHILVKVLSGVFV